MNSLQRYTCKATIIGLCLASASGAYAQISSINSAVITPRVFNDMPSATGTYINSYPGSITLGESGATRLASGGLDRDYWAFSNNGSSPYILGAGDTSSTASMTVNVTGTTAADNEAGFIIPNGMTASYGQGNGSFPGGDMQFLADPQSGFLGFFGGPGFWNSGLTYTAGETVTMGMTYFYDTPNSEYALQFSVNAGGPTIFSPVEDWSGNLAGDILGAYYQIGNGGANPASGQAIFGDISINNVPEPSTLAFLGLSIGSLLLRRCRK